MVSILFTIIMHAQDHNWRSLEQTTLESISGHRKYRKGVLKVKTSNGIFSSGVLTKCGVSVKRGQSIMSLPEEIGSKYYGQCLGAHFVIF